MARTATSVMATALVCVGLLSGCAGSQPLATGSGSGQETTQASTPPAGPPMTPVPPTTPTRPPILVIGPMSAGDVPCPAEIPSQPGPDGLYPPPASTPRSDVDLRRPIVDAALCTRFNDEVDGTNRGVERRSLALGDLAQLRTLAQQTTSESTGAQQVACTAAFFPGAPTTRTFVLRVDGQREVEILRYGCGIVRVGEASWTTPYLDDAFARVLDGSAVIGPAGAR